MKNEAYSISATDIEIWAAIGVHKEESFVENCFRVNVAVVADYPYKNDNYLNYEILLDAVKLVFKRPHKVLEDICVEIIDEVRHSLLQPLSSISCEIKKIQPAIATMSVGSLSVKIVKEFKE